MEMKKNPPQRKKNKSKQKSEGKKGVLGQLKLL
jgi:hypothetical protein